MSATHSQANEFVPQEARRQQEGEAEHERRHAVGEVRIVENRQRDHACKYTQGARRDPGEFSVQGKSTTARRTEEFPDREQVEHDRRKDEKPARGDASSCDWS